MKDRFSDKASGYAAFRPKYPESLFSFVYSKIDTFGMAWDAGTGNGQVAGELAVKFNRVYATDISIRQLMEMPSVPNISSFVADESAPQIPDGSVDLITVAQAIHWFDAARFCKEVTRVATPGAVLAIWGYGLVQLPARWQPAMEEFYSETVGPYWDPERKHIDTAYKDIVVPFQEISVEKSFEMEYSWSPEQLEGYLNTWSAVGNYVKKNGANPVSPFINDLSEKALSGKFTVSFPVFLRLFQL